MEHVKHPTLGSELLHGQTILERKSGSQPRQRGRLFVSDKKPDGSFILRFRPEPEHRSQIAGRTSTTDAEPDPEPTGSDSSEGRLLLQSEVDRIRANSGGERQLTGCAFTLDVVRKWAPAPASAAQRPGTARPPFRKFGKNPKRAG